MRINGRLAKLAGALTPPLPEPREFEGHPTMRIDPRALRDAVAALVHAGLMPPEALDEDVTDLVAAGIIAPERKDKTTSTAPGENAS
jgi:hypothetical protein